MRLAIFLPNWVGDVVMATPALRALARHFGARNLVGVMRPFAQQLLAGTPWLGDTFLYDPKSRDRSIRTWPLIQKLRAAELDGVVLLTNTLRTGLLAWLSGASERVGYDRYGRGMLLTRRLEYPKNSQVQCRVPAFSSVDFYLQIAYAMGCRAESRRLELAVTPKDLALADEVWDRCGFHARNRVVVLNSSGAFGAAKLWPTEHFAALARRIVNELHHDVLVICGPSEEELAREIVSRAGTPGVHTLAGGPLSLGLSKACVQRSRLMVTTDSGPRHFAVAFDVPIVGLFGPTPPIWGYNPTAQETALQLDLDCSGCHRRKCPLGHHRCMRDLSVDMAFGAVAARLAPSRKAAA